ncbi:MAG: hypothetical protein ABTD50_10845 [Polyangiaceae bacterium]
MVAIVPAQMPWARLVSVACAFSVACSKSNAEGLVPPPGPGIWASALAAAATGSADVRSVPRCSLVTSDRAPGLVSSFEALAGVAPAGYPNWVSIAQDGAEAARVQDLDAVKAACRSCHAQYEERYRRERATGPH